MRRLPLLIVAFLLGHLVVAQDWKQLNVDELFAHARQAAFDGKREEARVMLLEILDRSPDYTDVRVFLARTYAWDGRREDARKQIQRALETAPDNLEAMDAGLDVELWDDRYDNALALANRAEKHYPNNEDILYKKASALHGLKRDEEAARELARLLTIDPGNEKGHALLKEIRSAQMLYTAGVAYTLDLFSRTYDPAHYLAAQVAKTTKWGSAIVRLNYANRFGESGVQPEIDVYPTLAKGVYAYLNYGYSTSALYPFHRIGGEIHTRLPHSMEASAGVRYLDFGSASKVVIYTGSVGWYTGSYWLSFRPYITPGAPGTSFSSMLTVRKYFADADNYFGVSVGLGYSPDERRLQSTNGISTSDIYVLQSQRVGAQWQKTLPHDYQFIVNFSLVHQELSFDQGNYVWISSTTIGLRKRF